LKTVRLRKDGQEYRFVDLASELGSSLHKLPISVRLLAENHIRSGKKFAAKAEQTGLKQSELDVQPCRLLMHDTTATPALTDLAALRDVVAERGADPASISTCLPVHISIDHSLAVDAFGGRAAFKVNARNEIKRNKERYSFLKWAENAFEGITVFPPGTGIMHTINLEQLSSILCVDKDGLCYPELMLGTDSHTTMVNGIGVLAWGIGGLEAESIMLGNPATLSFPKVIGVRLSGRLPETTLATDLALKVTSELRKRDVAGCFVEFFGWGASNLRAQDRCVVANMSPEYGATTGYFPVDSSTLAYLESLGRDKSRLGLVEEVFRAQGLWFDPQSEPEFDEVVEIDLGLIRQSIAGPRRPQDFLSCSQAAKAVETAIGRKLETKSSKKIPDGAVGIAAITSCTNTSDPRMLITAGLLARNAVKLGLRTKPWVKTSLAPGSPSTRELLDRADLLGDLEKLGFGIVGYGCTTCIGNSGSLPRLVEGAINEGKAVAAVLSGNRNFPGRVHPSLDLGFLASPPLVIAYAILGDVLSDPLSDPLGVLKSGEAVTLSDIWPGATEINECMSQAFQPSSVKAAFKEAMGSVQWDSIDAPEGPQFPWVECSRVLRPPKYVSKERSHWLQRFEAQPLIVLGDDITTDHISPAGAIDPHSAAGTWLQDFGADPANLNVYASYRGNWEVMLRGLFTNRLANNFLQEGLAPAHTIMADRRVLPLADAAQTLAEQGQAKVILAGERYGMGSSRDWAAKGVALLDIHAVVAKSFERIHRTNLIGMGVVPVQIIDGFDPKSAGIRAGDRFALSLPPETLVPGVEITMQWLRGGEVLDQIHCKAAVDTFQEVELLRHGGVLSKILSLTLEGQKIH